MSQNPTGQSPDEWTKPGAKPGARPVLAKRKTPAPPSLPAADAVSQGSTTASAATSGQGDGKPTSGGAQCLNIPGIGDRLHHLAMSLTSPNHPMRQQQLVSTKAPGKIRPMSKAECARSRGAKNFCDPSHPAGCGGKYCGHGNVRRPDDFV